LWILDRPAETGESLTDVVIHSLEERLEHLKGRRSVPDLTETLMVISRRCSSLPDLDTRDAEEIPGYDEKGAFYYKPGPPLTKRS
jgi:hypothetical protein